MSNVKNRFFNRYVSKQREITDEKKISNETSSVFESDNKYAEIFKNINFANQRSILNDLIICFLLNYIYNTDAVTDDNTMLSETKLDDSKVISSVPNLLTGEEHVNRLCASGTI